MSPCQWFFPPPLRALRWNWLVFCARLRKKERNFTQSTPFRRWNIAIDHCPIDIFWHICDITCIIQSNAATMQLEKTDAYANAIHTTKSFVFLLTNTSDNEISQYSWPTFGLMNMFSRLFHSWCDGFWSFFYTPPVNSSNADTKFETNFQADFKRTYDCDETLHFQQFKNGIDFELEMNEELTVVQQWHFGPLNLMMTRSFSE